MSRKLIIQAAAQADLEEQAFYLSERNLEAALRFASAAQETIRDLVGTPEFGSLCQFRKPAFKDLRVWPVRGFRNYLIYYRPTGEGIEVIRVLHGARDAKRILNT